jgi:L-threonylcarbamoyladenylate synthase
MPGMTHYHTRVTAADDPASIAEAAALIRSGELVAFPTETVYGLGANALDENAARKIFTAKGRPASDPLIVHVASADQLPGIAAEVPPLAERLIKHFWPGPLTLLFERTAAIPDAVTAGLSTVAVRMPAHPVALALIEAAQVPIAAPSANRFAHTSPTTAAHVLADLDTRIPLILDGGATSVGVESTILKVTGLDSASLLRPGGVTPEALAPFVPLLDIATRYIAEAAVNQDTAIDAPGMLLRHYSPRAQFLVFDGPLAWITGAAQAYVAAHQANRGKVGYLLFDEAESIAPTGEPPIFWLGSTSQPDVIARRLFAGMRWLDDQGVSLIIAVLPDPHGIGLAIRDRMIRAAEGQIERPG